MDENSKMRHVHEQIVGSKGVLLLTTEQKAFLGIMRRTGQPDTAREPARTPLLAFAAAANYPHLFRASACHRVAVDGVLPLPSTGIVNRSSKALPKYPVAIIR